MKTGRRLLFLGCVPLLVSLTVPSERHAGALSTKTDHLQSSLPECSARDHPYEQGYMPCVVTEPTVSFTHMRISTLNRVPSRLSREESKSITMLLQAIVGDELSQCVLGIVWDQSFSGSEIVDQLSLLPNIKQVLVMYSS